MHMSPSGPVNREEGGVGVQLGDRGLLGGAQLAARVLSALRHERGHKHEQIRIAAFDNVTHV